MENNANSRVSITPKYTTCISVGNFTCVISFWLTFLKIFITRLAFELGKVMTVVGIDADEGVGVEVADVEVEAQPAIIVS